MRFIQQLTETINPQLSHIVSSVPSDNMLEQFYAIYIMRLCDKALLAQLSVMTDTSKLFENIWSEKSQRDIICHELSLSHHLEEKLTLQLISEASPLVYQRIKQQASEDGLSIFDFLQTHVSEIKTLFPIWIDSIISEAILSGKPQADVEPPVMPSTSINNDIANIAPEPTASTNLQGEQNTNAETEEQPAYADLPKTKKRVKGKKVTTPRGKKPINAKKNSKLKKILMVVIPLFILNLIILGVWLWSKKTANTENSATNEVILTEQQDPNNPDYPVPQAQPLDANGQDMMLQDNNPNMAVAPQQPAQANGQNMAVPPTQPRSTATTTKLSTKYGCSTRSTTSANGYAT